MSKPPPDSATPSTPLSRAALAQAESDYQRVLEGKILAHKVRWFETLSEHARRQLQAHQPATRG